MIYETYNAGKFNILRGQSMPLRQIGSCGYRQKIGTNWMFLRLRHFGHFGDMSKQAVHAIQASVDLFLALAMNVTQGGSWSGFRAALQMRLHIVSLHRLRTASLRFEGRLRVEF